METREGSCLCGKVRLTVRGAPLRVGICHCTDCRQESGSAFTYYGVWPAAAFSSTGETAAHDNRSFCPACGGRLFSLDAREAEVKLGCLTTAPTGLAPTYELWIKRREAWLSPVPGARQFTEDAPPGEG